MKPRTKFFLALLAIYPTLLVVITFSPKYGFLALPRFGNLLHEYALPEVKAAVPPRKNDAGYDGQFYAQIAIDPTLQRPEFQRGIDDVGYRAYRIGLPAMAYVLGMGQPSWILQIYSVLNLAFWLALLWVVMKLFGVETFEQRTAVVAVVWTAGVLVSLTRALSDMPALCLGLIAIWLISQSHRSRAKVAMAMIFGALSGLFKETGLLSFPSLVSLPKRNHIFRWLFRTVIVLGCMMAPLALWQVYVKTYIGSGQSGLSNFTWPLFGWFEKMSNSLGKSASDFPRIPLLEVIGPISIAVQSIYLLIKWRIKEPMWRFGLGFAILSVVIGFKVWESQSAYSRVLLPVCVVFNYYLMVDRPKMSWLTYLIWFWIGNVGLLDRAAPALIFWAGYEWYVWRSNKSESTATAIS